MSSRSLNARVLIAGLLILAGLAVPSVRAADGFKAAASRVSAPHAADSVLVRFVPGTPADQKARTRAAAGGELAREYSLVPGLEQWRVPPANGMGAQAALDALARLPFVVYAEPDYTVRVAGAPSDPLFANLWGMAKINAPAAWDISTGEPAFVVADLDTGADIVHPDLAPNIWANPGEIPGDGVDNDGNGYVDDLHGWDFAYRDNNPTDGFGHGTHTAGTIGAAGNNGIGVTGVNWNVSLMVLKFLDDNGNGRTSDAIAALNYAVVKGVRVSNNSWGGGPYSQALYDAIRNAGLAGHLFVAAAGNGGADYVGDDNDVTPFYPASYDLDNVIAVAATNSGDNRAGFSNYGAFSVDLAAPGENILSTVPGGGYEYWGGTSMAAPHVAGVAALVTALHPEWSYSQVRDKILSTVRPVAALAGKTVTGGVVDAAAALTGPVPPTPTPTPTYTPTPTPTYTPTLTPTPTPGGSIHVGDLEGIGAATSKSQWKATVTITVHDSNHAPVVQATVAGIWTNGAKGTSSCVTGNDGKCSVVKSGLSRTKLVGALFTVTGVNASGMSYDASVNHDADFDTNGTTVTIYRP